jgi:hypothetical protein
MEVVEESVPGGDNDNTLNENLQLEEFDDNDSRGVWKGTRVRVKPRYVKDYATLAMVSQVVNNLDDNKISEISDSGINVNTSFSELAIEYNDGEVALSALNVCNEVPECYEDLQRREDKKDWMKAVDDELISIMANDTWELVTLPKGRTSSDKGIFISQENYLKKVLAKFKRDSSGPIKTPLEKNPSSELKSGCVIGDKPSPATHIWIYICIYAVISWTAYMCIFVVLHL